MPGERVALDRYELVGSPGLSSAFDVDTIVANSVGAAAVAIAEVGVSRGQAPAPIVIDGPLAGVSFAGHVLVEGQAPPKWADLSGYYETGDERLIQFHCNFDHHAAGVVDLLGGVAERKVIEKHVRTWSAGELETALIERDMIAAKLRTLDEWNGHPHALATADLPLLRMEQIGDADPVEHQTLSGNTSATTALQGVNVLDYSRVLAGPVAGQTLAAHGANVLRISSPNLPSVEICLQLTGAGKRNAEVDLGTEHGQATMSDLLKSTNVWIDAYRPGALASKGFSPTQAAEHKPGIVIVQLSAFDWTGPWAGRRGFDSIVQSTTGVVDAGTVASASSSPMPLPVQALDYATGHLAAFAAARALQHQAQVGGSWLVRLSLLRTRNWLVGLGGPTPFVPQAVSIGGGQVYTKQSPWGELTLVKPITGEWSNGPDRLGTSSPTFASD